MRSVVVRLLAVAAVCLAAFAAPASAQYMYLDVDGDGVNTTADVLTPTTTGVDVWLRTNSNADGSPATCNTEPGTDLTINSYEFMLRSSFPLTYGAWTDNLGYTGQFGDFVLDLDTYHGRSGPQLPPGNYKLGRLALSGITAGTTLAIIPNSPVNPPGYTSFGTLCPGNDFDNTYKLGSDWMDVGNTHTTGPPNQNPTITAPDTVTVTENQVITVIGSATDADGNNVTLTQTNTAPFLTGPASAGPALNPSITLTGTANFEQMGTYSIEWNAADNSTGTASATTVLVVNNLNRPPVITAPATATGTVTEPITVTASATDPDGEGVLLSQTNDAPFFTSTSSDGPSVNPTITLTGTPTALQAGTYGITWSANDFSGGTPTASTVVTITGGGDLPVALDPIADITVAEGASASTAVSATDPDGELVTLAAVGFPAFAVLNAPLSGTGTVSTTITATPPVGAAAGSPYSVSVTATAGATTDTENFQIIVTSGPDVPPVLTPIGDKTLAAGSSSSFPINATDANGDTIQISATLPSFGTLDPPTIGTGNITTSFTLAPGAGDAGTYTATVTATAKGATDSETFTITVSGAEDSAPVLQPITAITVAVGGAASTNVSATDADGDPITLTASLPSFATLNPPTTGTGSVTTTITAAPQAGDAGSYTASVTATANGLTDTESFTITVTGVADTAPVLSPIANITVAEGGTASTNVSAADADGDVVNLSASLPSFATLNPPTSGTGTVTTTVTAAPQAGDAGTYTASVTATANGLTDTESFTITVTGGADTAPVLTPIANITVAEGGTASTNVSATDADGDPITLTASLPSFATLNPPTTGTGSVATTVTAAPQAGDEGTYTASVTATANGLTDTETFSIIVTGGANQVPTISAPATRNVDEGQSLTFQVTANDADNDPLTITAAGVPSGATFQDNGNGTANFTWTPTFSQAGSYTVTFSVSDGQGGTNSTTTVITVNDVNRCPTADAGGPYSGAVNTAITFSGTGSSDPDNNTLTYSWTFGDGGTATGATVSHAYATIGVFNVVLTVSDGICDDTDGTTATITSTGAVLANVFTVGGNSVTNLRAGKPTTCVNVEPVNGSFEISNVDLSSIKMISVGTGSVSEITALSEETQGNGDKNRNGVREIEACFSKEDLRLLFGSLAAGRDTVTVTVQGTLLTGGTFSGTLQHTVRSFDATTAKGPKARISPNPFNPSTTVSFQITKPGRVSVKIYDMNGRLVKTLLDGTREAGYQDLAWNGLSDSGSKVASGTYYFRLDTPDGRTVKSATLLK